MSNKRCNFFISIWNINCADYATHLLYPYHVRINQLDGIARTYLHPLALRLQLTQFNIDIIRDRGTTVKHSLIPICHKQPPCYNLPPRRPLRRAPYTGTYVSRVRIRPGYSPRDANDSHLHRGPIRARRANVKRFLSRAARPICYIQRGAYENTVYNKCIF